MVLKKHIGLTCILVGFLITLFSTVCLASTGIDKPVSCSPVNLTDNALTLQNEDIPGTDMSIKQNVDFIYRLKNYRLFNRNDCFIGGNELNRILHQEIFIAPFFSVPRPAYYNYLFMFKPFE